jgi:glyoxylase-like metal-dependent hydrolase (beta-lactamase superfamily II)
MRAGLIALSLIIASGLALAQDEPSYKYVEVIPGMFVIDPVDWVEGSSITLLVGEEHIALIDVGYAQRAPQLMALTNELAKRPVDFVINTHLHGDHSGANAILADDGAIVVAHDNVRTRMEADKKRDPNALPVLTFSKAMTFHVNDFEAEVIHVEHAHTDGDAIIRFEDRNLLNAGDVWFNNLFPYIDLDNGGTVEGYVAAQRKLLSLSNDDTIIIPGHGDIATPAALLKDVEVLEDCVSLVEAMVKKGLSDEDILAANPLAIYHDEYNWGFITTEKMTKTLIRALKK